MQRPKSSPYTNPLARFYIGPNKKRYYVRRDLVQRPEWVNSNSGWLGPSIDLGSVDEDTGHTLVHYLHTSAYETLDNMDVSTADHGHAEFKRAIRVYFTARMYDLSGLQQLAVENIEFYSTGMTIFDVFDTIDQEFPEFQDESGSFYNYLKKRFRIAFEIECASFMQHTFFHRIRNIWLHKIIIEGIVEQYNVVVSCQVSKKTRVKTVSEGNTGSCDDENGRGNNSEGNPHHSGDVVDRKTQEEGETESKRINNEKVECERVEQEEPQRKMEEEAAAAVVRTELTTNNRGSLPQPEIEVTPVLEPGPVGDGGSFRVPTAKMKKVKKGKIRVPLETIEPVPDSEVGFEISAGTKGKKKKKSNRKKAAEEEGKVEELPCFQASEPKWEPIPKPVCMANVEWSAHEFEIIQREEQNCYTLHNHQGNGEEDCGKDSPTKSDKKLTEEEFQLEHAPPQFNGTILANSHDMWNERRQCCTVDSDEYEIVDQMLTGKD